MKRAGVTEKISVSVKGDDLRFLKGRAGGNVSAAIAELVEAARRHQARLELIEWLGVEPLTDAERDQIHREQDGGSPARPKRRPGRRTAA